MARSDAGRGVIGQRRLKLTARQEREAYDIVTYRDRGRCQRCGHYDPTGMQRDHRQGRDAYNTIPANLHLLGGPGACDCHRWVTEHPREAMEQGFTVSRWADPATVPAYRFGVGWVLYLNEPDTDGNWWRKVDDPNA